MQQTSYGSLSGSLPLELAPRLPPCDAPTLGGRLMPVRRTDGGFDLFWKSGGAMATFQWQPKDQRLLILARPDEKNVAALFDAASEKGIGMPMIKITGCAEFQRLAVREAAKRGLLVDTSKLEEEARELYARAWRAHNGEADNSIAGAAYESAAREEQRHERNAESQRHERDREEQRRRPKG